MFATSQNGSFAVATAPEDLDARNSQEAREQLKKLIGEGHHQLVIDLSSLSFIDSSGLGALVAALKAARQHGGNVRLCGLTPGVQSIFELTRLSRVFDVYDSVDAAVENEP